MRNHLSQAPPPVKSQEALHESEARGDYLDSAKSKHLLFFVGFGLEFQGVECPFHSLGQVNGVSLKPPLGASDPVFRAPSKPAVCSGGSGDSLGMSAGCPQNPVGMQAVLLGAGCHWKREASDLGSWPLSGERNVKEGGPQQRKKGGCGGRGGRGEAGGEDGVWLSKLEPRAEPRSGLTDSGKMSQSTAYCSKRIYFSFKVKLYIKSECVENPL